MSSVVQRNVELLVIPAKAGIQLLQPIGFGLNSKTPFALSVACVASEVETLA